MKYIRDIDVFSEGKYRGTIKNCISYRDAIRRLREIGITGHKEYSLCNTKYRTGKDLGNI